MRAPMPVCVELGIAMTSWVGGEFHFGRLNGRRKERVQRIVRQPRCMLPDLAGTGDAVPGRERDGEIAAPVVGGCARPCEAQHSPPTQATCHRDYNSMTTGRRS